MWLKTLPWRSLLE